MIDKLQKLFNTDQIEYDDNYDYYYIDKKIIILIYTPESYLSNLDLLKTYCQQRKNCWIIKSNKEKTHIYFNIDYIKYILRNKSLNNLLND
jgi:hypothetical protein